MKNMDNQNGDHQDNRQDELVTVSHLLEKRPRRKPKLASLSQETYNRFLLLVTAGGYDHVAAASLGINPKSFYAWILKGKRERERQYRLDYAEENGFDPSPEDLELADNAALYLMFLEDVEVARSKARLSAEHEVKEADPKFWLTHTASKSDWSPNPTQINLEGRIQQEIEVHEASQFPTDEATVIGAFALFQELGLIQPTAEGEAMFKALSSPEGNGEEVIDVESNGEEEDPDEESARKTGQAIQYLQQRAVTKKSRRPKPKKGKEGE